MIFDDMYFCGVGSFFVDVGVYIYALWLYFGGWEYLSVLRACLLVTWGHFLSILSGFGVPVWSHFGSIGDHFCSSGGSEPKNGGLFWESVLMFVF